MLRALGIGINLPFATRSLGRSINSLVYSVFLLSMPIFRATEAIGVDPAISFTATLVLFRSFVVCSEFHYSAPGFGILHTFLLKRARQTDLEAVKERSGPRFEEAVSTAYNIISSEHGWVS